MEFYTYIYYDVDGTPLYVGKGKDKRAFKHMCSKTHLGNVLRKREREGHDIQPIITYHDTEEAAMNEERRLIAEIGRADLGKGPLLNVADGGEGAAGSRRSAEFKANLSKLHTGKPKSAETRAKMSAHAKTRRQSEETKERIRQVRLGTTQSEETKAKRKISMERARARKREEKLRSVDPG